MALLEYGLALSLALVLAVMGYTGVSNYSDKQDDDQAVIAIHDLRQNVHNGYQGRDGYAGISTAVVDNMGLLPRAMAGGSGPLNTTLTLSNAGGRQFNIVVGNLQATDNSGLCTALMTSKRDAWQRRAIGSAVLTDETIGDIQAACESANQVSLRTF